MRGSAAYSTVIKNTEEFAHNNKIYVSPELLFYFFTKLDYVDNIGGNYDIDIEQVRDDLIRYIEDTKQDTDSIDYNEDLQSILFEAQKLQKDEDIMTVASVFKASTEVYPDIWDFFIDAGLDEDDIGNFIKDIEGCEYENEGIHDLIGNILNQFPFSAMFGEGSKIVVGGIMPQIHQQSDDEEDEENKPWSGFCTNLCKEVLKHPEPLVGRASEMNRTLRILCRKEKANVIHLGDPGVGKTAMTLGLARKLNEGDVPNKLKGHKLYSLNMGSLMAGTHYRGDLEERIKVLIDDLDAMGNAILYIDEVHLIVGSGATESSSMDVANILKQALIQSSIKFIGSTTHEEYRKYIEKDKALCRRFKTVELVEPSIEEAKQILGGTKSYYEEFHGIKYSDEAISSAVELTSKYINDKFLPDKAIDIIDEVGAEISKNRKNNRVVEVSKKMIEAIVSENCQIPEETVSTSEGDKILKLESEVSKKVFGQDEAIKGCIDAIKLSRAGLTESNKPIASLLFVGQTGVGKTEIAKQIAETMGVSLIRFDMSEYMDATSVNKLIGSSAGYVGYEDGGLLVEKIRQNPHCVLLLDEIEKAHSLVFNALLQVMDNATLTDNKGRVADFKNVLIIMTSNAGASGVMKKGLGFGASNEEVDMSSMSEAVKNTFTPEFRNRLTKVITLNSMNDAMADLIVKKYMDGFKSNMASKGVTVKYGRGVRGYIKEKGITKEFGARPLIRVIDEDVKMLFVDGLLTGDIAEGSVCTVRKKGDTLTLEMV